jgi:hypothetical protein
MGKSKRNFHPESNGIFSPLSRKKGGRKGEKAIVKGAFFCYI